MRANDCKGHEAGCTGEVVRGTRCDHCRAIHNAREAKRRKLRRKRGGCWVCGQPSRVVDGVHQSTCDLHQHYSAAMRA